LRARARKQRRRPQADVAEIGDMIRARAEKEIYDQAKKKG